MRTLMNHPLGAALLFAAAIGALFAYAWFDTLFADNVAAFLGIPWWATPTLAMVVGAIIATAQALRGRD